MKRNIVKRAAALLAAALMLCPLASAAYPDSEIKAEPIDSVGFDTEASAMALVEKSTGTLIAEQNGDLALPMASTTKIMTALVVLKTCALDELVEVPDEAVGVEGSSMYLERGETLSVEDLLYGLMLASGNDAAVALAVHAGGSVERFVGMMNEEAEALGLKSTHFVTPNGLTAEGHQTTALELCAIACRALDENDFKRIVSTQYHTTQTGSHTRTFKNKNSLLWDYEGAMGVKTGYTLAAGRCLVFAAEREGMTVVGALLNCRPMFEKAAELMDFAFENYSACTVIGGGERAAYAEVENGVKNVLAAETKNSIIILMQKGDTASVETRTELYPLTAPVKKGQTVGLVTAVMGGRVVGSAELVAAYDVEERDFSFWLRVLLAAFA